MLEDQQAMRSEEQKIGYIILFIINIGWDDYFRDE
jgi:hypothetical protein